MNNEIHRKPQIALILCLSSWVGAAYGIGQPQPDSTPDYTVIWKSVQASDYREYIANMQAIGCPPQTIRDIVSAEIVNQYQDDRLAASKDLYNRYPFWKSDTNLAAARSSLAERHLELDAQMNALLQSLLGADVPLPDTAKRWRDAEMEAKLAFLPQDKLAKVKTILDENETVNSRAKTLADGICVSVETNELQRIMAGHQAERDELRALLTDEEFQGVEMATSWTGENLRQAMVHFNPTQEEFQAIFAAWREHDEQLVRVYACHAHDLGNAAVYDKIKSALSEARYPQYCQTWWK